MGKKITGLIVLLSFLSACGQIPSERPSDFSLSLDWDTGSLPPQYRYAYVISIGPGSLGQLFYQVGYDSQDQSRQWITDFSLSDDELDDLYAFLKEEGVFEIHWETGQPLLGGSTTALILTAYGNEYRVPNLAELSDHQQEQAEAIIEGIRSFVPQEIWDEMQEHQQVDQHELEG